MCPHPSSVSRYGEGGRRPSGVFQEELCQTRDGSFWRDGIWYTYRGAEYWRAMEKGAEHFGWREKWKGWLGPSSVNGAKRRGVGVGIHGNADVGEDASEAYVHLGRMERYLLIPTSRSTEQAGGQPPQDGGRSAAIVPWPRHSDAVRHAL